MLLGCMTHFYANEFFKSALMFFLIEIESWSIPAYNRGSVILGEMARFCHI